MPLYRHEYHQEGFKRSVKDALGAVERILEVHRNPQLAENVEHEYGDKYGMADRLTNTAVIAQMNCLASFGLTSEILQKSIDKSKSTTLRFQASDSCSFLKEQLVQVVPDVSTTVETTSTTQTTTSSWSSTTSKSTVTKAVQNIKEYHWKVDVHWEVSLYSGTHVEDKTILQSRSSSMIVVTRSRSPLLPENRVHTPEDVPLTWLLKQIDTNELVSQFKIDTESESTKTPRRNVDIESALAFFEHFQRWTGRVRLFFTRNLRRDILDKHNPASGPDKFHQSQVSARNQLTSVSAMDVFVPLQPLMEKKTSSSSAIEGDPEKQEAVQQKSSLSLKPSSAKTTAQEQVASPLLSVNDMNRLLNEQVRTLEEHFEKLRGEFPPKHLMKVVSVAEAMMVILCEHADAIATRYAECMTYIEKMLEEQLVAAIGKTVNASDLDNFMKYHNAKLLDPPPMPFCQSIRRPFHYPDGLLSIESTGGGDDDKMEPIETCVKEVKNLPPLKVPLNASTTVELTGKTYLHGWVQHWFQNYHKSYQMIARARQFSSFLLVIGTMMGSDKLHPKDAIIVQNKDEVIIPLLLKMLPSAKEFKNAIKSLSPEQQRFAKAYRNMQLESSVFGVCVIQIKPQLEELLGLPADSLTKEMKLTQELMDLFMEYQVPSDMLSYDGNPLTDTVKDKIKNVQDHVDNVSEVITASKLKQLEEQTLRADMTAAAAVASGSTSTRRNFFSDEDSDSEDEEEEEEEEEADYGGGMDMFCSAEEEEEDYDDDDGSGDDDDDDDDGSFNAESILEEIAASAEPRSSETVPDDNNNNDTVGDEQEKPELDDEKEQKTLFPTSTSSPSMKMIDFTKIPKILDATVERHDTDNSLRSVTIKTADSWTRKRQENLLSSVEESTLTDENIRAEKNKAFDLLDALCRSGSLSIKHSELHVIVSLGHCFDNDVMGTVLCDNINPIEKLERSILLVSSTIHDTVPLHQLISNQQEISRLSKTFPKLFLLEDGK